MKIEQRLYRGWLEKSSDCIHSSVADAIKADNKQCNFWPSRIKT